ncbi:MAG: hypothetical protein AAFV25_14200 [Bacteroidota bacterium]
MARATPYFLRSGLGRVKRGHPPAAGKRKKPPKKEPTAVSLLTATVPGGDLYYLAQWVAVG